MEGNQGVTVHHCPSSSTGVAVAVAPAAPMPIETLIFRYPADKNLFGFEDKIEGWVSHTDPHYLDESPLLYYPNFYYIFYELDDEEYKKRLAEREKVITSYRVWYSLEE